jgi:lipoate-protein ligase A
MILWLDGPGDAPTQMARDAALLEAYEAGRAPWPEPVLRLFAFDPPGITLGHAQDPARELDLERCRMDGIRWAVRPTGGRAIFHAEEWTYSLTAPITDPEWGGTLAEAYARASRLVAGSLRALGVPADLVDGAPRGAPDAPRVSAGAAPPCFASTARHEVELGGRKLVGSAQRRLARTLQQQGSVLLGDGHLRLADYVAVAQERRERVRAALAASAATAGTHLPAGTTLADWARALLAAAPAGTRLVQGAEVVHGLTLPEARLYSADAHAPGSSDGGMHERVEDA